MNPISDMITRIRNSKLKLNREVSFPFSKFKLVIAEKIKSSGYFSEVWTSKDKRLIKAKIKYFNKDSIIKEIVIISKPSKRIYLTKDKIKKSCIGKKNFFVTTSQGLLTHKEAIDKGLGGELMFFIS
jgi:small subunit ribosomal protein S8